MKVAISLPDPIFREAEILAEAMNKSRSQLYAEAVADFVSKHGADKVTERLDAVYAQESSELDDVLTTAQLNVLADETW